MAMKATQLNKILKFIKDRENIEQPRKVMKFITKQSLVDELEAYSSTERYTYDGDLDINNSDIKKLPNDLYVKGTLNIRNCKELINLPDKLYVQDDLYMEYSDNVSSLPNNLYVGQNLYIMGCVRIAKVPNNLYIYNNFYISNTPLAKSYSIDQLYDKIESTGGQVGGEIDNEWD
jgi:hypothetical protein